jgi:SAM-dependent MidA family methyltransferase
MTLLRRYIGKKLSDYYAQPSNLVVGASSEPINFRNLLGEWHWKRVYKKLYDSKQGQWLTPVELFRPHYSQILAEYCIHQQKLSSEEFEIVELGGGRGTNASCILDHLQQKHPEVYERLSSYTIVDSSPSLHALQQELLLQDRFSSKLKFLQKDLTDVAEAKTTLLPSVSKIPTIFLALELLDNLGHDKVIRDVVSRKIEHAVIENGEEVFRPLSDQLLKQVLLHLPSYGGSNGQPIWVPSVACGVLMEIAKLRPNSWLVLADFDFLPTPDLDERTGDRKTLLAEGEPLVTDMNGIDHDCYLNSPQLVDVLYPVDFVKLARFSQKVFGGIGEVALRKQNKFLLDYGPSQIHATRSRWTGFSPMIHDFSNCSVLTISHAFDKESLN